MTIRIWNSYSCNNSSSYRLVARFADPAAAAATADELRGFFTAHAEQMDKVMEDGDFPAENPQAAQDLAKQYGFAWEDVLTWGDEMLSGDEPAITTQNEVLVVYHTYCGGYGAGIPKYLAAKGAVAVEDERRDPPMLTVLLKPSDAAELEAGIAKLFAQVDADKREVEPLETPWPTRWDCYGRAAFFRDTDTVAMHFPIAPVDIASLRAWLAEHGVTDVAMELCSYADEDRFRAIAHARCRSCSGALHYLDPRLHDIEKPQLLCKPCGGFYDLDTFPAPDA